MSPALDTCKTAAALLGSMVSILTLVRVYPDRQILDAIVSQAIAALDG